MHQFLELIGIIVVSIAGLFMLGILLICAFRGPRYLLDRIPKTKRLYKKTTFNSKKAGLTNKKLSRCVVWTQGDDDYLKRLYTQHYSIEQISEIIGVRQSDVVLRLEKLKLIKR